MDGRGRDGMSEPRYVDIENSEFPTLLKHIIKPPKGVWVRGEMPNDDVPRVAIIGSRACSEYGISAAAMFARDLAQSGVVVVSGMARGIDAAAHRAAIEAGGKTVAVLGCGVDVCYPPEHDQLMEQIIQNGCIISEYENGTKPQRYFFPERNRIVSGLCHAVIVVEATEKSGTSVTANHALDQGREVFAVPGSIFSKVSRGTNDMLKQGAIPATCAEDVLRELKLESWHNTIDEKNVRANEEKIKTLAPNEKLVYDSLGFDVGIHVDEVIHKSGLPAHEVQYILMNLEINGRAKRLPGGKFVTINL